MFSKFLWIPLSRLIRITCHTALLIALLSVTAHAQMGGIDSDPGDRGTGGQNTIQGSIYLPSGRRAEKQYRIRLSGVGRGDLSTLSDSSGAFSFRRLAGGSYRLTIDAGKEFEAANETVDIFDAGIRRGDPRAGQVITLQIQLRMKSEGRNKPAVINAALAGVPKAALELYKAALQTAQAGDRKKAIEQLKSALDLHPQFTLALNELGVQYMRLNQLDKAADALRAALKIEPETFTLRLNYGIVLVQKKQFAEGAEELQSALEKNKNSATAHLYRGRALIGLRLYEEARQNLEQAIAIGGDESIMAHRFLGALLIETGEDARAVATLEKYLQLAPQAKDAEQIREIIKQLRSQIATTQK